MGSFEVCHKINDYLEKGKEDKARNLLIRLLDKYKEKNIKYTPLINHLIRQTGLYPYMELSSSSWEDRYVHELFKTDIGSSKKITLHREQSLLLKKLLSGKDIAVSAPTSFGKSFVVDSFISIKKPKNVVIIVPTIALTDETRRRVYKKFSFEYKIITTPDSEIADKNIFIFPQERAISYVNRIDGIDILIIDEFYKASSTFDKERSPTLLRAILKLGEKAKQRYFLAPNITQIKSSIFTENMEFLHLDFNTVFLEKHELYKDIDKNEGKKREALLRILDNTQGKSLIYAGTYSNINKVSKILNSELHKCDSNLLTDFQQWLDKNYTQDWYLSKLINKGCGIHNGRLHRSLSQIQIKLFEEPKGLNNIISTSSIIEGVNTSTENVILWSNKNGQPKIDNFTFKNIIGRSGRMFKHFIGKVYILEEPPEEVETQLSLAIPDGLLGHVDNPEVHKDLTREQIAKINQYEEEMSRLLGKERFDLLQSDGSFYSSDSEFLLEIAKKLKKDKAFRKNLQLLNIPNSDYWESILYDVIKLQHRNWGRYGIFVSFVKNLPLNWKLTIPQILQQSKISIEDFFQLERTVTFQLASLLSDINNIQLNLEGEKSQDITPFISKASHAFLPTIVYQLEEYGLPRMISKKIHDTGLLNFHDTEMNLHEAIDELNSIGLDKICGLTEELDRFDEYVLEYFFEGISSNRNKN